MTDASGEEDDRLIAEAILDGNESRDSTAATRSHPELVRPLQTVRAIMGVFDALGVAGGAAAATPGPRTLAVRVQEAGPLAVGDATLIAAAVCRDLAADGAGRLRGPIKPASIVEEADGRIVLLEAEGLIGTPLHEAPEVLQGGAPNARSDVYSVGVLLHYLLTGTYPFYADDVDELRRRQGVASASFVLPNLRTLRPDLPAPLLAAIARALGPAATRPATPAELAKDLASSASPGGGRVRSPIVGGIGAALLVLALAFVWVRRTADARRPADTSAARRDDPTVTSLRLWEIDTPTGKAGTPEPRLVAPDLVPFGPLSLSADGRILAFATQEREGRAVWVIDRRGGRRRLSPATVTAESPVVVPDGSRVFYARDQARAIESVAVGGGDARLLCEDCGTPTGVSADGRHLLLQYDRPDGSSIGVVELASGRRAEILRSATAAVSAARFSPDGRFVVFHAAIAHRRRDFIGSFRGPEPIPESDWRPVADEERATDGARFSVDGREIYFASGGDLWREPFDGRSGYVPSAPRLVAHLSTSEGGPFGFAVAGDVIVWSAPRSAAPKRAQEATTP